MIHDISRSPVAMSGAPMSRSGPMIGADLGGVAAHDALDLALGEPVRVAAHAALRSAERQAEERALVGHPHRERRALAKRDARRQADAALRRAHDERVLDAVARELLDLAVVAADREVDDEGAARLLEALAEVVGEADRVRGALELRSRDAVELRAPLGARRDGIGLFGEDVVPAARTAALDAGVPIAAHRM